MAKIETVLIWEKSLYCHVEGKGWTRFPLARLEDAATIVQEHIKVGTTLTLIYDPDVLHTEQTDCPSGGRNIVREAVAATHEAVANMHTAWGYQTPVPIPGSSGMNSTFCSYETVPSLLPLKKALDDIKRPIQRAFPLISLATQAGATPGRTTIFIVVDHELQAFVYLHTSTGMRACRKLYGGKREDYYDVWAEISLVFGEYGVTMDDGGQRPSVRIYQAGGTDAKAQCPYWESLHQMAQVEIYNFSVLASLANNLPARHVSSLMEDMPRIVRMDMGFQIAGGVLALILLGFGGYAYFILSEQAAVLDKLNTTARSLAANRALLNRNKEEMETLKTLYAQSIFQASKGRFLFLDAFSKSVPKDATVISVNAGLTTSFREAAPEDVYAFHLRGIFWNAGVEGTGGGSSANTVNPASRIGLDMSPLVPGLLLDDKKGTFNPTTGDFTLSGTTPRPTEAIATATPPANTPLKAPVKK